MRDVTFTDPGLIIFTGRNDLDLLAVRNHLDGDIEISSHGMSQVIGGRHWPCRSRSAGDIRQRRMSPTATLYNIHGICKGCFNTWVNST
ncbi:hypothetical protein KEM60_00231 [Austwickia sp. TVS 96-490-7B]|nr:hypothetical protein [Austwickia sp. TVS 96-490-7B]